MRYTLKGQVVAHDLLSISGDGLGVLGCTFGGALEAISIEIKYKEIYGAVYDRLLIAFSDVPDAFYSLSDGSELIIVGMACLFGERDGIRRRKGYIGAWVLVLWFVIFSLSSLNIVILSAFYCLPTSSVIRHAAGVA